MTTVRMGPRQLLEFIKLGIQNGNHKAAIGLCEDALAQLPEGTEYAKATPDQQDIPTTADLVGDLTNRLWFLLHFFRENLEDFSFTFPDGETYDLKSEECPEEYRVLNMSEEVEG